MTAHQNRVRGFVEKQILQQQEQHLLFKHGGF